MIFIFVCALFLCPKFDCDPAPAGGGAPSQPGTTTTTTATVTTTTTTARTATRSTSAPPVVYNPALHPRAPRRGAGSGSRTAGPRVRAGPSTPLRPRGLPSREQLEASYQAHLRAPPVGTPSSGGVTVAMMVLAVGTIALPPLPPAPQAGISFYPVRDYVRGVTMEYYMVNALSNIVGSYNECWTLQRHAR